MTALASTLDPKRWALALRRLCWCLGLCLVAAALPLEAVAGATARSESAIKAAFLFRFTTYVEWPAAAFQPGQPLVIGVLDDEAVAADLEQMVGGRSAQGRPVAVRRVSAPARAHGAHVLFIGRRSAAQLREAVAALPDGPMLLVADQEDVHPPGIALNFQREGGRVRFTASPRSADARGLLLGARLLQVAKAVEERTR